MQSRCQAIENSRGAPTKVGREYANSALAKQQGSSGWLPDGVSLNETESADLRVAMFDTCRYPLAAGFENRFLLRFVKQFMVHAVIDRALLVARG